MENLKYSFKIETILRVNFEWHTLKRKEITHRKVGKIM